jgi:ABC-2 type transport system ATP-binding protein
MAYHAAFHPRWDSRRAADLTTRFTLPSDRPVGRLSKGETGKLMILLALAQTPELLVLDEPTDGLDPVVRREALGALLDYVAERGATVFISSHLVHELERICDWVGVLDGGALAAELPMEQFRSGIKRLRVVRTPAAAAMAAPPFAVLTREHADGVAETWTVRGWEPSMSAWFESAGGSIREVGDLDLEDAFVELLRASRAPHLVEG